jgi:serine/threonine-protein kinase
MGRVFRAELSGPGGFRKALALKLLPPSMAMETEDRGYVLRHEARVGALLHHPNIVEVYDFGLLDGQPWISMELVEGTDLERLIRLLGPTPPSVLLDIACQICDALGYAHDVKLGERTLGLVHRDLKPSNVLLSRDGCVKLADFGIARATLDGESSTSTGIAKGTPCYMSPEQARGSTLDRRSDLFALGSVLYWMATGKILFRAKTPAASALAIVNVDRWLRRNDILREVEEGIPGLGDVLWRCLQKEVARRPHDAGEVAGQLLALRSQHGSGPSARVWLQSQWELLQPGGQNAAEVRRQLDAFQLAGPPGLREQGTEASPDLAPAAATERRPITVDPLPAGQRRTAPTADPEAMAGPDGVPALEPKARPAAPIGFAEPPWTRPPGFRSGLVAGLILGAVLGVAFAPRPPMVRGPADELWIPPLRTGPRASTTVPITVPEGPLADAESLVTLRPVPASAAQPRAASPVAITPPPAGPTAGPVGPGMPEPPGPAPAPLPATGFTYEHQPVRWVPAGVERSYLLRIRDARPREVTLVIDAGGGRIRTSMSPRGGDLWTAKATLSPGSEVAWTYWFEADLGTGPPLRILDGGVQPWPLRVGGRP